MPVHFRYGREPKGSNAFSKITKAVSVCLTLLLLAGCSGGRSNVFNDPRDERLARLAEERTRLAIARTPVDRTRIQVEISNLLISLLNDAVSDLDVERIEQRVTEYRETVRDARDTMINSGRNAAQDGSGFLELEMALRYHEDQLEDIGGRLTFQFREPIDDLRDEVAEIRDEVFAALFPRDGV